MRVRAAGAARAVPGEIHAGEPVCPILGSILSGFVLAACQAAEIVRLHA